MGPEERQPEPHLSERLEPFEANARRFSFFRLVYLLERLFPNAPPVGQLGPASSEKVRLRGDPSLVFAASDVTDVALARYPDGEFRARVSSAFLGLYGATSPLPTHFAEQIALSEYQGGPQPVREFFDVLHHRLLSLFYRAWTKYRLPVVYRTRGDDPFSRRMMCCVGIDGFREHEGVLDRFLLLRYAPLLAFRSRSQRGLEVVLEDLFGHMGVKIDPFVGHWTKLERSQRNRLGVGNNELGVSLTIGRYVYDGAGRFKITFGPLEYDEYLSFLPGGARRPLLRALVDTFTPGSAEAVLELRVKPDAAPRLQLGSPTASTLKRTAWVGGSKQEFVILVPLNDVPEGHDDEEDDDRGEPPPE